MAGKESIYQFPHLPFPLTSCRTTNLPECRKIPLAGIANLSVSICSKPIMTDDRSQVQERDRSRERDIAAHIFTTSSVMVGLCLTIISVVRSMPKPGQLNTAVDDLIAVGAMVFLLACFLSYAVLRARHLKRMQRIESLADGVFLLGLTILAVACGLFVWTIL
jgi:hypothetical protein